MLVCALLLPSFGAASVRPGPGGLRVEPATLTLTRSVTLTFDLLDASNQGAMHLGVEVEPDRGGIVTVAESVQPEMFSCTPGGRASTRWVFDTVGTGTVRFRVKVQMITCETQTLTDQVFVTGPVTVRLPRVDSALTITPRPAAPGDVMEYALRLRNLGTEEVVFPEPRADVDYAGRGEPYLDPAGGPDADPAAALTGGRLRLPPGEDVTIRWRYRTTRAGEARVQLLAAGMLIRPGAVRIRLPARLGLALAPVAAPSAVGRVVTVRGSLGADGDAGVDGLAVGASWSPPDAARLVTATVSATRVDLDGARSAVTVALEMLRPGPLMVTVTAAGREADSGRAVAAAPVTRLIAVQAPPELSCVLVPAGATVLVGSKSPFRLAVVNRSPTPTIGLAPITVLHRGEAETAGFSPMHGSVPGSGSVWFAGGVTPTAPGEVVFDAQVTGRGDRGGAWLTATSAPAWIRAVAPPRFEIWPLGDRLFQGVTATVRFAVRNAGADAVRVNAISLNLSLAGGGSAAPRVSALPLTLAPGAAATVSAATYLPPAAAPYVLSGSLSLTGTLTGWRLAFSHQVGSRPLVRAGPPATAITSVEPPATFRPVLDPLLYVEWTKTIAGDAGVAVTAPDGRPVRTLRALGPMGRGFHSALWRGEDDAGRPVPPGPYVIRLAGPPVSGGPAPAAAPAAASATAPVEAAPVWPMRSAWTRDHGFTVAAP